MIPTVEFNIIFQSTHIYSHLMNEGIGLRQLVDYYYVEGMRFRIATFLFKYKEDFSKIYPSFLTLKEGSTSHLGLLPSGKKRETAPPRRSEPLRSKVGGPSKVSPYFAGWDRLIIAC